MNGFEDISFTFHLLAYKSSEGPSGTFRSKTKTVHGRFQISSAIEFKIDNARPISNDKTTHVSLPQRRREGKPLLIISLRFLSCSIVLEKSCHNQRPEITLTSQVKMTGTTTMEIDQEENLSPSELAAQIAMRQSR